MRSLSLTVVIAWLALAAPALAATEVPYTQTAFAAAQAEKRPILVFVTASWCPVCAKQHPVVAALLANPKYKDLAVFDVDFDSQKDVLRGMGVQQQSTLIAFHGKAEQARATGITDPAAIGALIAKTQG